MFDLLETSKQMREQSNRHTQYPLFVIQELQQVVKAEGCGSMSKYYSWEGDHELTNEQYEKLEEIQDGEEFEREELEAFAEEIGSDVDELDKIDLYDYRKIEYDEEWVYCDNAGFFFTEAACHEHIEHNKHHYNQPRSYVISAWRNPEIVATMLMILKLTGDEYPDHYRPYELSREEQDHLGSILDRVKKEL